MEQIVIILFVMVIALIIIASFVVGKRFVNRIQDNVETVPSYQAYMPQD